MKNKKRSKNLSYSRRVDSKKKALRPFSIWVIFAAVMIVTFMSLIIIVSFVFAYLNFREARPIITVSKTVNNVSIKINSVKQADKKSSVPLPSFVPDYTIPSIQNGMAPVVFDIPTNQKVVFLTIDDGAFKDQSVVDIIQQDSIKASLFLVQTFISGNPDFFKQITAQGSLIEDHTISHDLNMATDQTYDQQKAEICGMADYELAHYGRRPIFFRPPGGAYSDTMRRAAADCGMKAVVTWIAKANAGSMQYQIGNKLRPGDIVLMHFRPEFRQDMQAFLDAQNAAGLHTELLEDFVAN
jgi:peptidoglycan/xylan/chitin deacetylase (PgdA/CDA1 family)